MNRSGFFICDRNEIEAQLITLQKTGVSDDGWSIYYSDPADQQWVLTHYHPEYQGGGIMVLKHLPVPDTATLITIAMTSGDKNDIDGASLELLQREQENKEDFRKDLISRLADLMETKPSDFDKERIRIIIRQSELFDSTNKRDIVGKHWQEIEADARYFQEVSIQAKSMLNKIGH